MLGPTRLLDPALKIQGGALGNSPDRVCGAGGHLSLPQPEALIVIARIPNSLGGCAVGAVTTPQNFKIFLHFHVGIMKFKSS